jgi:hypothetical protein
MIAEAALLRYWVPKIPQQGFVGPGFIKVQWLEIRTLCWHRRIKSKSRHLESALLPYKPGRSGAKHASAPATAMPHGGPCRPWRDLEGERHRDRVRSQSDGCKGSCFFWLLKPECKNLNAKRHPNDRGSFLVGARGFEPPTPSLPD